jgi:hypothetical protein
VQALGGPAEVKLLGHGYEVPEVSQLHDLLFPTRIIVQGYQLVTLRRVVRTGLAPRYKIAVAVQTLANIASAVARAGCEVVGINACN